MIENKVAVVAKFNRTIALDVKRFGTKEFGFVCRQTGRRGFITSASRFALLAQLQSRYVGGVACWSSPATIHVNPKGVAQFVGIDWALDLLLTAGFVRCNGRKAEIIQPFDLARNQ